MLVNVFVIFVLYHLSCVLIPFCSKVSSHRALSKLNVGDAKGEYYGEAGGSYMLKEFK